MAHALGNYLQLHRRRTGLTQVELGFLLGYENDAIVSRMERDERQVTLAVAFACQLIFGTELKEIFPTLHGQVEDDVARRMYELCEQLKAAAPSRCTAVKREALKAALARALERAKTKEDA